MMLLGTGEVEPVINFNNVNVYSGTNGIAAEAGYQIQSNGYDYKNANDVYTQNQQWVNPTSAASNYEVYATVDSGSLSIGSAATGTWIAVTDNPEWIRLRAAVGISETTMSIEVRKIGTSTILAGWFVTLTAERLT